MAVGTGAELGMVGALALTWFLFAGFALALALTWFLFTQGEQ